MLSYQTTSITTLPSLWQLLGLPARQAEFETWMEHPGLPARR